jgi:hypothetical protein
MVAGLNSVFSHAKAGEQTYAMFAASPEGPERKYPGLIQGITLPVGQLNAAD